MQQVALRPILGRIPTIAPIPHRGLLYLHGSQASEFLNGVLASTVSAPSRGHLFSCFLHAQGRVLYDVFIFSQKDNKGQDGYLIEYDSRPSEAPPILSLLKRYVLRSKVKMEDLSNTYDVWAAWNSEADSGWETKRKWIHSRSGAIEPVWDSNEVWPWGVDEGVLRDRRAVGMGRRLLVPKGEQPKDASTHDIADSVAYNAHRIMHGVPEGIDDIQPMHSFPMESNLDVMGGLDFRKGCYVGQELTVRTYHTGIIRKRIIPVDIQYKGDNAQKEPFSRQIIAIPKKQTDNRQLKFKARSSSKLLTTVDNSALALLRLDHVSAADKGEVIFRLANEDGESVGDSTLTHNWPEWWPKMPVED